MGKEMTGHCQHTSHFLLQNKEETQPPESATLDALSVAEPNNPLWDGFPISLLLSLSQAPLQLTGDVNH